MIRAVIFDLDGTLADTRRLGDGFRWPWDVLNPGYSREPDWRWPGRVAEIPGLLIARGYRVAIVTDAQLSYASTLAYLIGAEVEVIRGSASWRSTKADVLADVLSEFDVIAGEAIYVGPEDSRSDAHAAGMQFVGPEALRNGELLRKCGPLSRSHVPTDRPSGTTRGRRPPRGPTMKQLIASFGEGIPDPANHSRVLIALEESRDASSADIAAACFFSLLAHPGLPDRQKIQGEVLQRATVEMTPCVIRYQRNGALFQFDPRIVTRSEMNRADLAEDTADAVRRLFPVQKFTKTVDDAEVPFRYARLYDKSDVFGTLLGELKNYGDQGDRYRSGPKVKLGMMDLVARIMASSLPKGLGPGSRSVLVPVPASAPSADQPGEFSLRIAHAIAGLSGVPIVDALTRDGDSYRSQARKNDRRQVILIDDQITSGGTVVGCIRALEQAGWALKGVLSYSVKPQFIPDEVLPQTPELTDCALQGFGDEIGWLCPCQTTRAVARAHSIEPF